MNYNFREEQTWKSIFSINPSRVLFQDTVAFAFSSGRKFISKKVLTDVRFGFVPFFLVLKSLAKIQSEEMMTQKGKYAYGLAYESFRHEILFGEDYHKK